MTRLRAATALALATITLLGACSTPAKTPPAAGTRTTAAPATMAPPPNAKAILDQLTAAGLPVTGGAVQDENTDPNSLLGRPNGYLSRASFDLPGGDTDATPYSVDRGGCIEVWADAAAAKARAAHITTLLKDAPLLGTEYDYLNGAVLVRIAGKVKPSVAAPFEKAVAALKV